MQMTLDKLNCTISEIYSAVGAPNGFGDLLKHIRASLGASGGMLFTPSSDPESGGFGFVDHLNADLFAEYRTYYWDKDPWGLEAKRKGLWFAGSTGTDESLISRADFQRTEIYSDYLSRLDTVRLCFTVVAGDTDPLLPGTHLSLYRGLRSKPFTDSDVEVLKVLRPHVAQALRLAHRLGFAEASVFAAYGVFNALRSGIVLLDQGRRVIFLNRSAEALLLPSRGLVIRRERSNGASLHALTSDQDNTLQRLITNALVLAEGRPESAKPLPLRIGTPTSRGIMATTVPLPPHLQSGVPAARIAVFLEDLDRLHVPNLQVLVTCFGLTPAEARVAGGLLQGSRPKEIAASLALSEHTIRSHIKALYQKTGQRGVGAMIATLASTQSPASWDARPAAQTNEARVGTDFAERSRL